MWSPILLMSIVVVYVTAHGRVLAPPSRASAWRLNFSTPVNYDDAGVYCGGLTRQKINGGKCGICGDAYDIPSPRPHELGGTYGLGIVVAHYLPGSLMTTKVELTTSHQGFWEFKLCPNPHSNNQTCFDKYVLATENGETKYYPKQGSTKYYVTYRLPSGLVCDHCVLQWRYTAGNNWGVCENGTSGRGCGIQETFGACSDISIGMSKNTLRGEKQKDNILPPLMYHLKNGYFDAQQGILHLLREKVPPNKVRPSQNSVQQSQRPSQPNHQRPPQSIHQGPTQPNQRPTQPNQQLTQPNQQPTQPNPQPTQKKHHPVQSPQVHPNQITSQNSRPGHVQSNQRLTQNPPHQSTAQGKPAQTGQPNQQRVNEGPLEKQTQKPQSIINHQQSLAQNHPQNNHHSIHQNQLQDITQSQLNALVQKHKEQKQLKKLKQIKSSLSSQNSIHPPLTQSLQITTHTVHSYTMPVKQVPGHYKIKQWKTGKSAKHEKSKKRKRKGKPRKRKKKIPEYNRVIKVGTW